MTPLLVALPGSEALATSLSSGLGADLAEMSYRRFPDGESYVRYLSSPLDRHVILVAALDRPDEKVMRLLYTADGARDLGARRVGLVAPYLPYMRQDMRFNPGEVVTSVSFARLLSAHVDWLLTIDPHLHRWTSLDEIYTIPAKSLHADSVLADWIATTIKNPVLIGPDSESAQWVSEVAGLIGCRYVVLSKSRFGDREVRITAGDLSAFKLATPVIVDDTISSAHTMIETVKLVRAQGLPAPVCCAVHGVYDPEALKALRAAGPAHIVTSNTVSCETAEIDVSDLLLTAIKRDFV